MTPPAELPATIGRYEIIKLLGRGGVGEVYLARDPMLDRQVAIKILSALSTLSETEKAESKARFFREARAAAALSHPNIVTIFDVGEQDGIPFIAMEYLRGTTLDRHAVPAHLLPPAKVVEIGIQAAAGLGEAHRAGLVHRDIKPANLILLEDGTVKVADFGLAKDPRTTLTSDQTLLGTPNYMSPEQIAGRNVDARADLFSLGISIYELLAGTRPFTGDTISSVLYRIVNDDPTPLTKVRAGLPDALQAFFRIALAKDPDERYASAADFAAPLATVLEGMGGVPSGLKLPPPAAAPGSNTGSSVSQKTRLAPRSAALARSAGLPWKWFAIPGGVIVLLAALWFAPLWAGFDPLGGARRGIEDSLSHGIPALGNAIRVTHPDRTLSIETDPPGLKVRVGGGAQLLADGHLLIPGDLAKPFEVAIDDRCRGGATTVDPRTAGTAVRITAARREIKLAIDSDPSGAEVFDGGKSLGGRTPLSATLEACRDHSLEFRAAGREPRPLLLGQDETPEAWAAKTSRVGLTAQPPGELTIPRAPGYEISVAQGGRAIGRGGQTVSLAAGRYALEVSAPDMLYREQVTVTVASGGSVRLPVTLPGIGRLVVRSVPSGAKVVVRAAGGGGQADIGVTNIPEHQLAAGGYEVTIENPNTGAKVTRSVTLQAGQATTVAIAKGDWP